MADLKKKFKIYLTYIQKIISYYSINFSKIKLLANIKNSNILHGIIPI